MENDQRPRRAFRAALLGGAMCAGFSPGAHAQAPSATATSVDEVVITGSRTIRNGDASPSPVTVVSTQDMLRVQPGILADALNSLPVFAGSRGTGSNPSSTGSQAGGNGNANQLNLRNLGVTRTLVLLDGYRVPPTSFNNAVDVDIIPQMLVQRVDTVTGGVSAVYGSDAVAGVVNYILDRKFNGLKVQVDYGGAQQGDNKKLDAGIAAGASLFGGRGHIEGSYQYIEQKGILGRSDRDWLNQWGVVGAGSAANPFVVTNNIRQAGFPFGGLITGAATAANPLGGQTFASNGVLRPFVAGAATGTAALQIGGDGGYFNSSLVAPLSAHQLFGRYDQDLTDNLRFYAQVSGDLKTNENYSDPVRLTNQVIQSNNPFLAPAYQAQLAAAKQTTFRLSELMGDFSRLYANAQSKQWIYSAGFDGSFRDYRWGVNLSHGTAHLETELRNNPNNQHIAAALDAVLDPTGKIVCNITLTNPTLAQGCQPLNPFGPTAASAEALAFITQPTFYTADTVQDDIAGHITGSPFAVPAGPVNMALSAEWRKLTFRGATTGAASNLVDCTGIRTNCVPGTTLWAFSFTNAPKVSQTVKEVAVEANVPVIKDVPFIKELNVNGAARYTTYDTSGDYVTWKIGGDWHVTEQLRFRATKSRDIRAPTLYEAFTPINSVTINPVDLLTGLSPSVPSIDLASGKLQAEIADTTTGGIVWNPTPTLGIALDAYRILLNDAITQVAGNTAAYQQLCYASGGSSIWCSLQSRPLGFTNTSAANAVTRWNNQFLNLAQLETKGADLEVNYSYSLWDRPGSFRLLTAYQPHVYYRQPGVPTIDQGNVAFGPLGLSAGPAWRVAGFARFAPSEHLTIDVLQRWRSAMKLGGDPTQVWVNNRIGTFATTNATVTYTTTTALGATDLVFNVTNLFDATPPGGGYSGNGTRAGLRDGFALGDDVVGRAFTLGVRIRR